MKILVDADACPVKEIIVRAAKKYEKEVLMVCDVAHQLFYEEPFVTAKTVRQCRSGAGKSGTETRFVRHLRLWSCHSVSHKRCDSAPSQRFFLRQRHH